MKVSIFRFARTFRQRLIDAHAEFLVLEPILTISRERGWLKAGGKQRTDSTAVLAAVRTLNSLESVGESMRAALNDLAKEHPEWLLLHLDPTWFDRYVHRFEMTRFPKQESKQKALRKQVGEDVARLARLCRPARDPLFSAPLAIRRTAPTSF